MATTADQFTATERDLLRRLHAIVGPAITYPGYLRDQNERSGGGRGFAYEVGTSSLHGTWHEWLVAERFADGSPRFWRTGELLREAHVSFARVERWAAGLPGEVRAKAQRWWATYPRETRDLPRLAALTLAALDGEFDPVPEHPALFEVEGVGL
ncbi:hypothetical protein [Nocardia sp. NPDC057227]|uniref:hypothetical protein n=1 Tax=Nocardia sp. NPDC057227 TaxID=3346056 RepID=UPI00364358CB